MADNKFLLTGYRINFTTGKRICKSLFMFHNETINIWSHMIGVGFFICLLVWIMLSVDQTAEFYDLNGDIKNY